MSMVAWFLYYKIAAGELGERMSGHGTSGSVHGPCVRVQSYSGRRGVSLEAVAIQSSLSNNFSRMLIVRASSCYYPWFYFVFT